MKTRIQLPANVQLRYCDLVNAVLQHRILIVDDTPANLLALRAVLEPLGAEIVQARSGEEALTRLAEHKYDAVIMDVRMPGLDGFETAARMRKDLADGETPIVFVTASDIREEDVVRAYAHGQAELMPKPFVPEAMRDKVRTFMELAARTAERNSTVEQRAAEAEERLQVALSAANMVAWSREQGSDTVVCSAGDVELFGFPVTSMTMFRNHVHPDDLATLDSALENLWSDGGVLDVEFRVIRNDGSVRWIDAKGRRVSDSERRMKILGVCLDVTAKRAAQTELQQLNIALKEARDKALYATHAKTVFLNSFGHELKTPLNGIINFAEMIEEELQSKGFDQVCDDAQKIRKLGAQLDRVVEQIFSLVELDNSLGLSQAENDTPEDGPLQQRL